MKFIKIYQDADKSMLINVDNLSSVFANPCLLSPYITFTETNRDSTIVDFATPKQMQNRYQEVEEFLSNDKQGILHLH